jgi:hypothetical protein
MRLGTRLISFTIKPSTSEKSYKGGKTEYKFILGCKSIQKEPILETEMLMLRVISKVS